jgi:hypothetical protein
VPSQQQTEQTMPFDRHRLTAMIDKLVAVQMDLKPLCDDKGNAIRDPEDRATITEACSVLQSAIDDLKQVIFNLDGFKGTAQSRPSSTKGTDAE